MGIKVIEAEASVFGVGLFDVMLGTFASVRDAVSQAITDSAGSSEKIVNQFLVRVNSTDPGFMDQLAMNILTSWQAGRAALVYVPVKRVSDLRDALSRVASEMGLDADVIDTTPAVITAANVITVLEAVVAACPATVQEQANATIITDHQTKYFYREAARGLDVKGSNIDGRIADQFGGFPLVSVGGMPASTIVMAETGGTSSNLKASTWMESDFNNIIIERVLPSSDLFFAKSSFDLGVNTVFGAEIVLHEAA